MVLRMVLARGLATPVNPLRLRLQCKSVSAMLSHMAWKCSLTFEVVGERRIFKDNRLHGMLVLSVYAGGHAVPRKEMP